ncbi:MAG TPA: hypothetical protein VI653_07320 [Steroidobacteraceae bacterium]
MSRKPPKRVGDHEPAPLTPERVAELAVVVADPCYVLGPQDQLDLVNALADLVGRMRADEIGNSMSETKEVAA